MFNSIKSNRKRLIYDIKLEINEGDGFSNSEWVQIEYLNWMEKIPSSIFISNFNIPGTHDSGTKDVSGIFKEQAKCQSLTIEDQLNSGIRYFDIRINNKGRISHGKGLSQYTVNYQIVDVILDFTKFLDKNPTEAIIMKLKNEDSSGDKNDDFINKISYVLNYFGDRINYKNTIPLLGEIRNKIWLIDDFEYGKGFSSKDPNIIKQNEYKLSNSEKKKILVREHFFKIRDKLGKICVNNLSMSPASVVNLFENPEKMAKKVNDEVFSHIGFLGIVVMDFPSNKVIKHIIDQNLNVK